MSEFMGPNIDNCPASILNLLSPLSPEYIAKENNWAHDWRERCRAKNKKPKSVIKEGQRVFFERDLEFTSGFVLKAKTLVTVVKVPRRKRSVYAFRADNGGLYSFKGWKNDAKLEL